jgi:hypothetical protein
MSHSLPLPAFVWLRRATLDNMLAQGADPSDALAGLAAELRGDDPKAVSDARPAVSMGDLATGSIEDMTDERFAAPPYPSGELALAVRHANAALLMR